MRFGEYKDALILIERYPLFGVGFTGTPDMDIYLGVSMLYLIIAENMGVIGLAIFLAVMVGFFVMALRAWRRGSQPEPGADPAGLHGGHPRRAGQRHLRPLLVQHDLPAHDRAVLAVCGHGDGDDPSQSVKPTGHSKVYR